MDSVACTGNLEETQGNVPTIHVASPNLQVIYIFSISYGETSCSCSCSCSVSLTFKKSRRLRVFLKSRKSQTITVILDTS